jgi:hypothetical protein
MLMLERFYDELTSVVPDRTQIQPVNITAASDWFYEGSEQEYWDFREDFPCVALPFDYTWMEFRAPKAVNSLGKKTPLPACIDSIGCFCSRMEIPEHLSKKVIEEDLLRNLVLAAAKASQTPLSGHIHSVEESKKNNQAALDAGRSVRWVNFWKLYCSDNRNRLFYLGVIFAYVDPAGQFVSENYIALGTQERIVVGDRALSFDCVPMLQPFLFATSLMHAKNVSLESNPLPEHVARRRTKEGKRAITFKVLQINPIRQQANKERDSNEQSAKRAMHIVRGHFKDYREGAGLFGKLKGLYWWDMHVAGDAANGQVVKDYAIGKVK